MPEKLLDCPVNDTDGRSHVRHGVLREDAPPDGEAPLRLNLGAGGTHLAGFVNVDRKLGTEAYPLAVADGSCEEIVASHVLEHFSHRQSGEVLKHWVDKLKPGGKLRLAVPDFEWVAKNYLAGEPVNVQGYVMGGHVDADDCHGAIFDRECLAELMIQCGLERIGLWDAAAFGCALLPCSLNLQGFKPISEIKKIEGVRACLSTPRFGPLLHPKCSERAFARLGIEAKSVTSCYWAQQISNLMEEAIGDPECRYVLTLDFDTIFSPSDVIELYRLMEACPDVDAVFPLQAKRGCEQSLFSLLAPDGSLRRTVTDGDLGLNLLRANTGHFGLTFFRADSLRRFERPWMVSRPSKEGLWKDGSVDADIDFWLRWKAAGLRACLAPKVVVGHLEEVVKWPGKDLRPVYQKAQDYEETGIPAEVER